MSSEPDVKLAPPGAGLPKVELFVARLLFRGRMLAGSRESFTRNFQRERELVRELLLPLNKEAAGQRVLIQRLRGMEDSSRFWSVWMTLDHLRIVHRSMDRVIRSLIAGKAPPGAASTAAVKPSADVTQAVVAEYEKTCEDVLATVTGSVNLKTRARYAHPWFGPLNAAGWHALAGSHLAIHRKQIEQIIAGLPAGLRRGDLNPAAVSR